MKKYEPFIAHSEITNEIYIVVGGDKYCVTDQVLKAVQQTGRAELIVRCKDCKWFNDIGCAIRIVDNSDKPKDNDYCSFGERKNEVME